MNRKQNFSYFLFALLLFSCLHAFQEESNQRYENENCSLDTSLVMTNSSSLDLQEEAAIQCKDPLCYNFSLNLDLLYWRSYQASTCCASQPDNKWNVGYRIGVESFLANHLNIQAFWTHFQSQTESEAKTNSSRLHYDAIDIACANCYCINSCFSLEPSLGLRYAKIRQYVQFYGVDEQVSSLGNSLVSTDYMQKVDFNGFGPRFNLEGSRHYGCGFSFIASIGASVLYGHFNTKESRIETFYNPEEIFSCQDNCQNSTCLGAVDATLGAQWEKCFCDKFLFSLKLAWEHHNYLRFLRTCSNEDLSFDGISLSAQVFF